MKTQLTSYILKESQNITTKDMRDFIVSKLGECDDATVKYIYNKIISRTSKDVIEGFLASKFQLNGKPATDIINDIIDHAIKFGDIEALTSLATSKILISKETLLNGENIFMEINKLGYGFSDNFINWLTTFGPKNKGKGMGAYEILLQLFVDKGHLSDKGDVGIDNLELELKGTDARLTGQGYWGNGRDVYNGFMSSLISFGVKDKYRNAKIPLGVLASKYANQKDANKMTPHQLYYKTNDAPFYNLIEEIKSMNDDNYYDALLRSFAAGISKLYSKIKEDDVYKIIKDLDIFNKSGKVDYNKIVNTCASFDLYYYATIEKFDYIGFFSSAKKSAGKYKIFDGNTIRSDFKNAYNIVSTYLSCSCPNTKQNSTAQDSFSQINIK